MQELHTSAFRTSLGVGFGLYMTVYDSMGVI